MLVEALVGQRPLDEVAEKCGGEEMVEAAESCVEAAYVGER